MHPSGGNRPEGCNGARPLRCGGGRPQRDEQPATVVPVGAGAGQLDRPGRDGGIGHDGLGGERVVAGVGPAEGVAGGRDGPGACVGTGEGAAAGDHGYGLAAGGRTAC